VPATTATQGLIYPIGTDRACDGASQLEVLAKGINGRFVVLDGLLDQGEEPQMVLVEWVEEDPSADPLNITPIGTGWNVVDIDTANAFDQGVSQVSIKLPYTAPGQLWEVGCYLQGDWSIPPGVGLESEYIIFLGIYDSAGTLIMETEENKPNRSTGANRGGGSIVMLWETTGNDTVTCSWATFNAGDHRLVYGQMWAIRVSEV
jgi:hypothetical protein